MTSVHTQHITSTQQLAVWLLTSMNDSTGGLDATKKSWICSLSASSAMRLLSSTKWYAMTSWSCWSPLSSALCTSCSVTWHFCSHSNRQTQASHFTFSFKVRLLTRTKPRTFTTVLCSCQWSSSYINFNKFWTCISNFNINIFSSTRHQ